MRNRSVRIYLIVIVVAICILMFLPFLITDTAFILDMDMRSQYPQTFINFQDMIINSVKTRTLPFYSFDIFLGNNFWASKLFLNITIFEWLFLPFRNLDYQYIVMILTTLKLLVCAISFDMYLQYNKLNNKIRILFALLYTFSSYAIDTVRDPFFLSFYVLLPLYFLAVDKYIVEKKKSPYIFVTSIMLITSYYHFYTLSIISVIYFLYRFYLENKSLKNWFKSALPLIGAYFIAVIMCSVVLLPIIYDISQSERLLNVQFNLLHEIKTYFSILMGPIFPSAISINRVGYGATMFNTNLTHLTNTPIRTLMFCGFINVLLIPQMLKRKENKVLFAILGLLLLFPFFSSALHGFGEPSFRWNLYIVFFLCICNAKVLQQNEIDKRSIISMAIISISILLLSHPVYKIISKDPNNYNVEYLFSIICVVLIIIELLILIRKNYKMLFVWNVCCIIFATQISFFFNPYYRQISNEYNKRVENILGERGQLSTFLEYVDNGNRTELYRIYAPYNEVYWLYSMNMNLNYGFKGVMSYDSTYSLALNDLDSIIDQHDFLPWTFYITDPNLIDLYNVKYAIVTDESQLPHENFEQVETYFGLGIYLNNNYTNFARTFDEINTYTDQTTTGDLLNSLVVFEKDYPDLMNFVNYESIGVDNLSYGNNNISFEKNVDDETVIVLSIPYDSGWNVYNDGNKVDKYRVNGGLLAFKLNKGYNFIEMYFVPQGFKLGVVFSFIGFIMALVMLYLDYRKRK